MVAPIASKPFKCKSIGRVPIAQPPGIATRACPNLANNGPITTIDARILLTNSNAAVV